MISRAFTLCVPFVSSLAIYWAPLPMVALGIPTILAGILALVLPETAGKDLPQTIQEADQVNLNQSYPLANDSRKLVGFTNLILK
jgi:hypothetical protein